MKEPKIRKIVTNLEEVFYEGGAEKPVETTSGPKSIKTVSVAAVIKNPYAGQWVEDLSELTEYGEYLGDLLTKKGAELLGAENVETYGKGCIVGLDGELEHSSAMLHRQDHPRCYRRRQVHHSFQREGRPCRFRAGHFSALQRCRLRAHPLRLLRGPYSRCPEER